MAINDFVEFLQTEIKIASATDVPELNLEDLDDIPIPACATGRQADVVVTGDKALSIPSTVQRKFISPLGEHQRPGVPAWNGLIAFTPVEEKSL